MDTVVSTRQNTDPYTWIESDPAEKAARGVPMQSIDGGPQVSQPTEKGDPVRAQEKVKTESPRVATVRRVATAAAGVGLVAAVMLTARGRRGANAAAGENIIDYDG